LLVALGGASAAFGVTGYLALFHAWARQDLPAALPFLPWARAFGAIAVIGSIAAFAILFAAERFPLPAKRRLALSLLATVTIALFAEFRNEGKFHLSTHHHFLAPGEWAHDGLSRLSPALANFLYRLEFSHWNDFLIGPAIVSVIYPVVFLSLWSTWQRQRDTAHLGLRSENEPTGLDDKLQAARIVMYVGLFWFFLQAWGEKAGYLSNPHSNDAIDLPFEFAGTALGFWMARVLTRPLDRPPETFRSTLVTDLVASGVIGLAYTLIVGPVMEGVSRSVAHALFSEVPESLEVSGYTPFEQHMRPLELLLLAAMTWWACNSFVSRDSAERADEGPDSLGPRTGLQVAVAVAKGSVVTAIYLSILGAMFSILQPQGTAVALTLLGLGLGCGAAVILFVRRFDRQNLTTLFGRNDAQSGSEQSSADDSS
jgi:hypothetical protein